MRTRILVALAATLILSGNTFGQEAVIGDVNSIHYDGVTFYPKDCGCESSNIAPVVYQESMLENSVEGAVISVDAGSVEPMADSASVVESPIVDSATNYDGIPLAEGEVIVEGDAMNEGTSMAQGEMVIEGASMNEGAPVATSSCGCQSNAAPALSESTQVFTTTAATVSNQSDSVFTSAAAVATPCCETPARQGFFRRLFSR